MLNKLKGAAGSVADRAGNLKDAGVEALQATVAELNATLPRLREVGYSVNRVELEIGLSPKVILTLAHVFDVDAAAFAAMLAENAEKKVFCSILGALQQANQLQGKIHFRGRYFKELEIELGIPPAVRMVFLEASQEPDNPRVEVTVPPPRAEAPVAPEPQAESPAAGQKEEAGPTAETPPAPPPAPPADGGEWIPTWCAGCQQYFRISRDKAGLVARCRRCGTKLRVPRPS